MECKWFKPLLLVTTAATLVYSQQPAPNGLCDGVTSNSFVADPEDCSKFYQCNGDTFIHGACPNGMFYHSKDVCSIDSSDCESITPSVSTTTSTETPLTTQAVFSTESSPMDNTTDPEEFCQTKDPNLPSFVKSPTDCSEYYICVDHKPILQKCAAGRYWNPVLLYCDDPEVVPCEHDRILDPEEVCQHSQLNDISFTGSPTSCGAYYICLKQKPFLMQCAPGSYWNSETNHCDVANIVKCKVKTPTLNDLDSLCIKSNDTFISHPAYCDLYLFCRNGKASTQRCPFLTDWDTISARCVSRNLIKCTKNRLH
ncbi:probable chitinase 10 [Anopheles moucheti]|uniref:probable chitinase 10 n=1 Tax=Anopheles moucheti TaxID=186751 RepID=UPI0022F000B5|nr:probable chitinase 10 [Anopheles moucheti]